MKRISYTLLIVLFANSLLTAQVTSGLISKYSFTGNANDEVGTNNGTVTGATLTTDRFGNANSAYHFDGYSGNHINLGTDTSLKQSTMSISLWVKVDTNACYNSGLSYQPYVIAQNTNYPGGYFEAYSVGFWNSNNKFIDIAYQSTTGNGPYTFSTNATNFHYWHHLVVCFNYDSLIFYVDNVLQNKTYKGFTTTYLANSPVEIGYTGNSAKEAYVNGSIDDIRFYKRVISAKEVDTLFHMTLTSGVDEIKESNAINIYPNPTNNTTTIALAKAVDNATIKLISLTGQAIIEKLNQTGDHFNLDISQQPQGIYFVEIRQADNVWRTKLVKQ